MPLNERHQKRFKILPAAGLLAVFAAATPLSADNARSAAASPSQPLTERPNSSSGDTLELQDVLNLALRHNPRLASSRAALRAKQARAKQSGLRPNPTLFLEMENVGLSLIHL